MAEFFDMLLTVAIIALIAVGALIYFIHKKKVSRAQEAQKRVAAEAEEEKSQRIKRANEVKQKALNTVKTCEQCEKIADKYTPLLNTTYYADDQMDRVFKELVNAAELKGKLDSLIGDISTRGGFSK